MAYQTGSATSPSDLLTTLLTWLAGRGWTIDANATEDDGLRAHVHKSGYYVNLRAAMNEKIWAYQTGAATKGGAGNGTISVARGNGGSIWYPETITVTFTSATAFTVAGGTMGAMGSGTVGSQFVSKYVTFTITAGGTAFDSTTRFYIPVSPNSSTTTLASKGYGIGINAGSGYDGSLPWNLQPGCPHYNGSDTLIPIGAGMLLGSGAITAYHFFDDGADNITVLVEKSPGIFVHMGWGPSLVKHGYSWSSAYFFASIGHYYSMNLGSEAGIPGGDITANPPFSHSSKFGTGTIYRPATAFVRVDAGELSTLWTSNAGNADSVSGYTGRLLLNSHDPAAFYGVSYIPRFINLIMGAPSRAIMTAFPGYVLLPLWTFLQRPTTRYAPLGYPPNIFYTLATQVGVAAGSTVAIGGVNYVVAPNFAVKKV